MIKKPNAALFAKLAALYVLTITTAVACGKFEVAKKVTGSNNGTATLVADGAPGSVAQFNISIDAVDIAFAGDLTDDNAEMAWSIKMNITHGARKVSFDMYPSVNPFNQDGVQKTIAPMDYIAQGVCANATCSKLAVLLNVTDTSNGTKYQQAEYYEDLRQFTSSQIPVPTKRTLNSGFTDVTQAFELMSGEKLPNPTQP